MLQVYKIQILQDHPAHQLFILILAFLQDLAIVSGPLHIIHPCDLLPLAPCDILHEQNVVLLVDLPILYLEHAVYFGDECVAVGEVVAVEALQVLKQEVELQLVHCFQDVFAVGGEEEELAALAAVTLDQLVELVAILKQIETAPELLHPVLSQQLAEDLRREDGELPPQQGQPRQNASFLLVLLDQLRSDLEADFLAEEEILEVVDEIFLFALVHILLVGDLDAREDGHDLRNPDEIYLIFLLLDVQDLLLHADVDYLQQLLLGEPLLADGHGALEVGRAEDAPEELLDLVADFLVGEHHEDQVDEFYEFGEVEDGCPDEHEGLRVQAVHVDGQLSYRKEGQDQRHPDHEAGHQLVFLIFPAVEGHSFGHVLLEVPICDDREHHKAHREGQLCNWKVHLLVVVPRRGSATEPKLSQAVPFKQSNPHCETYRHHNGNHVFTMPLKPIIQVVTRLLFFMDRLTLKMMKKRKQSRYIFSSMLKVELMMAVVRQKSGKEAGIGEFMLQTVQQTEQEGCTGGEEKAEIDEEF